MRRTLGGKYLVGGVIMAAAIVGLVNCGDDDPTVSPPQADAGGTDTGTDTSTGVDSSVPPVSPVAKRASKSGTIAIADGDAIVGMVNPEDGSVSFFKTSDNTRLAKVMTGGRPSAIVITPDGKSAWVANRADATVVKVSGIDTATPTVGTPINVGAEPTGLALSPKATKLFVTEYAESKVGVIDTATGTRTDFVATIRNPRGIAVTNNGDALETDESVVVTEFFGEVVAGKEAQNDGRTGKIHVYGTDGTDKGTISLAPFTNTEATFEGKTSPNQLHAVAVNGTQVFVPSISTSPAQPLAFNKNLYAVVHVADLGTKAENTTTAGTTNLTQLVQALPAGPKFFLGDTVDMDFVPGTKIAYAVSRAADVIQRIDYTGATVAIGAPQAKQIDVQGAPAATAANACHNPSGIAIAETLQRGYVNCWGSHRMAVLDFTSQNVATVVESSAPAVSAVEKGRHFFFTGRGRWSGDGTGAVAPANQGQAWSACGSCHPDGLTDNVTWIFGAGPRQSTSMDGSFSHGAGAQKQRVFNWTGIIDEMHDFEANTRGTSGGMGAITNAPTLGECGDLSKETRRGNDVAGALPGALGPIAAKEVADGTKGLTTGAHCPKTDWDDINEYAKSIRPVSGRRFADAAAVARGLTVFTTNGCAKCHGGAGWTVSTRRYVPSEAVNTALVAQAFPGAATVPAELTAGDVVSLNTLQIQTQQPGAEATPDDVAAAPPQLGCSIRNVSSFGIRDTTVAVTPFGIDAAPTSLLEIRAGVARAQGYRGYNVPSLYSVAVGAPFLHHGQAATLEVLFTDTKHKAHWQSGNPNFDPAAGTSRADLIAFLNSIDATTAEVALPTNFDICPP